jgi:hypothetical protein
MAQSFDGKPWGERFGSMEVIALIDFFVAKNLSVDNL